MKTISLIIPCYNEEAVIEYLLKRLSKLQKRLDDIISNFYL